MSVVTNEANFNSLQSLSVYNNERSKFNSLLSSSSTPSRISQSVSFTAIVFVTPSVTSKHLRTTQNAWFREPMLPGAQNAWFREHTSPGAPKGLVLRGAHVAGRPKRLGSSRSTRCRAPQKAWFLSKHTLPGAPKGLVPLEAHQAP